MSSSPARWRLNRCSPRAAAGKIRAGGIFRGFKLIETTSGIAQKPTLRWLPDHLFSSEYANKTILLYYTGITRLAKNILHEIVRGIFLNSPEHLRIVEAIGANAITAFNAAQKADYPGLVESIPQQLESQPAPGLGDESASRSGDARFDCRLHRRHQTVGRGRRTATCCCSPKIPKLLEKLGRF